MEYVRVGSSGLRVSRLGLGMMSYGDPAAVPWFLAEADAEPIVRQAIEAGVTFFDTADMYSTGGSEQITGALLRRLFPSRSDYVLATKVYYPMGPGPNDRGLSRAHILDAVDASLRRLGVDHIDLYQVHRADPGTPIEETVAALADVVRAGKVRYVGASLMRTWQLAKAMHAGAGFVSMQNRWNLAYREEEREMVPFCADAGIGVLPYSPLARGLLAGRGDTPRARGESRPPHPNDAAVVAALTAVAGAHGVPPARVALAWLLSRPEVTAPIIGATRGGHITDAVAAVELTLSAEDLATLEAPYRPREPTGY
jgi:1-deoxyxylulose-5-phosphate synthase